MVVDFRSDTFTKPTKEMREAMFNAEVGDDVFQEDPTVKSEKTSVRNTYYDLYINQMFPLEVNCKLFKSSMCNNFKHYVSYIFHVYFMSSCFL